MKYCALASAYVQKKKNQNTEGTDYMQNISGGI